MGEFDPSGFDFDNPSALFRFEDWLKGLIGERLFYGPYFESRGGFKGDEQVLDFGCGGGASTRCIASRLRGGGRVVGVDVSSYFTEKARKRVNGYANAEILRGRIEELDLAGQSFDLITTIHVIHDIPREGRAPTVEALAALLKPGGRLWIWEPTKPSHGMPVEEIRRLMGEAGLREISSETPANWYRGIFER